MACTNDFITKVDVRDNMAANFYILRRTGDLVTAIFSLLLLSPFILLLFVLIRITGRGPVIYTQDRIGKNGRPFSIYKFRSMLHNAEIDEPLLSSNNKEQITRIGRVMRRYRFDEIPNFLNVMKGEMSIVGPRPERQFFIDQIVKKAPQFIELQKVKPGLTSWGQVRYGYATSVDEMIERMEYDLYYLKHRSLWFDLKIILYTVGTIVKGKGV